MEIAVMKSIRDSVWLVFGIFSGRGGDKRQGV